MSIENAIRNRRIISIHADGGVRLVHPHVIYRDKGGEKQLACWQVGGHSDRVMPDWSNFKLAEVQFIGDGGENFRTQPDYRPQSKRYHEVILAAKVG